MNIELNGVNFRYELDGPEGAPWIVFSNSLTTDVSMWDTEVAQLKDRLIDCGIRARPRMWLNVCVIRTKEPLGAFDRKGLDFVDHFATAVVTAPGISLGVLVGKR